MFIKGCDFMAEFNKKDFGEKLRKFRKEKGLSQENLASVIKKNATTIGRFENGKLTPNAEEIYLICNELGIEEYQLFNTFDKIIDKKNSKNPFGLNKLYVYYIGYYPTLKKYDKCKFVINLIEKYDYCRIELCDYISNRIYLEGYLEADNFMAFFRFNNYKPTSMRLECSQINLNISNGIDRLMSGAFYCTDTKYNTSARKCLISTEDLEFTDELLENLKIKNTEYEDMKNKDIWYIDMENKEDFEN